MGFFSGVKSALRSNEAINAIRGIQAPQWLVGDASTTARKVLSQQVGGGIADMKTAKTIMADANNMMKNANLQDETAKAAMQKMYRAEADRAAQAFGTGATNTIAGAGAAAGHYALSYFTPNEAMGGWGGLAKRGALYAGGAVGMRYLSGGSLTRNNDGERDIAGIPFI